VRVILAEDSVLLREGLARLLGDAGIEVTHAVGDADTLLAAVEADPPDVVVTDIRMPPTFADEGLGAALAIRARHPKVAVLVLSQYLEAAYAERLLCHGAGGAGYLLKDRVNDVTALCDAIIRVAHGESVIDPEVIHTPVTRPRLDNPLDRLTERERNVLALMAEGWSNQGIGDRLYLSATVERHVGAIMTKLQIADSREATRRRPRRRLGVVRQHRHLDVGVRRRNLLVECPQRRANVECAGEVGQLGTPVEHHRRAMARARG
jgi:DNA-binding NarL/FixJ family response regulator